MTAYLIGQSPDGPCPVCNVSPVPLVEIPVHPYLAECGRCGLTYVVRDDEGARFQKAVLALAPSYLEIFKAYFQETGRRVGPPPFLLEDSSLLDFERAARMKAVDEWLSHHPELVVGAAAPTSWPFVSLTLVATTVDGKPAFSIVAPPGGLASQPFIPIQPGGLPLGTIVTLQIPIKPGEPGPASPEIEGHA